MMWLVIYRAIASRAGPGSWFGRRARVRPSDAYGHSRLGEWVFGGMTRELLSSSPICCLMSHDLARGVLVRAVSTRCRPRGGGCPC